MTQPTATMQQPSPTKDGLREALAAYAHEAWSGWMRYLFAQSHDLGDQVMIPSLLVERWQRKMGLPYEELAEDEKESDREQADKILALLSPTEEQLLILEGILDWEWDEVFIGGKELGRELKEHFDDQALRGNRYRFTIERLEE